MTYTLFAGDLSRTPAVTSQSFTADATSKDRCLTKKKQLHSNDLISFNAKLELGTYLGQKSFYKKNLAIFLLS